MSRPHVEVFLAMSLDGFIAKPGGDLSWLSDYGSDSPEATGYAALMRATDTLVMGRNTYDKVLGFGDWPYGDKRVVVLTHEAPTPCAGETFFSGSLASLLTQLAAEGSRQVYLDGGAVVRDGLRQGLVDRLTLTLVPRVLGRGIALFGPNLPEISLTLERAASLPSGLVQCIYRPASQA